MADNIAPAIVSAADRIDDRNFATIYVDPFERMTRLFQVTGVSTANPEERHYFELIEDAINYLHEQGFSRLDADEEESMLNVINGGKERIEHNLSARRVDEHAGVISFAMAVFSKPTSPEDYTVSAPNNGTHELAAAILKSAQAMAKKRDPQIATIGKVPDDSVDQQYWVRGMTADNFPTDNRNGLFTYYEGALNFLTGKGGHRLESVQEERWKRLIDRANDELGPNNEFTHYGGTIVCVFSMN